MGREQGWKFKTRLEELLYTFDEDDISFSMGGEATVRFFDLTPGGAKQRITDFNESLKFIGKPLLTTDERDLIGTTEAAILEENTRGEVFVVWYNTKSTARKAWKEIIKRKG